MRFIIGPSNPFSIKLYLVGLPMVLLTGLDLSMQWQLLDPDTSVQIFIVGVLMVTSASLINLCLTIINHIKD